MQIEILKKTLNLISDTKSLLKEQVDYSQKRKRHPFKKPLKSAPLFIPNNYTPQKQSSPIIQKEPEAIKIIPQAVVEPVKKVAIILDKPKISSSENSEEIKSSFLKIDPHFKWIEKIPDDLVAKKIQQRWKTKNQIQDITILAFDKDLNKLKFLQNLKKAISFTFFPCTVIFAPPLEKENKWKDLLSSSGLKLLIASDHEIWNFKNLMCFYKENPHLSQRFLNDIPLFLLPDLTLYFKQPLLKRSLWRALCHKIQTDLQ